MTHTAAWEDAVDQGKGAGQCPRESGQAVGTVAKDSQIGNVRGIGPGSKRGIRDCQPPEGFQTSSEKANFPLPLQGSHEADNWVPFIFHMFAKLESCQTYRCAHIESEVFYPVITI